MFIKIGDEEYVGQCNALSYVFYKKLFKTSILDDLDMFMICLTKKTEENVDKQESNRLYEILVRLIYILIYTNNTNILEFEKWKLDIQNKEISVETINKITSVLLESFVDVELYKQMEKIPSENKEEKVIFPEHNFLAMCIKTGLNINDLKILSYVDALKIIVSFVDFEKAPSEERYIEATQKDWDNLAAM